MTLCTAARSLSRGAAVGAALGALGCLGSVTPLAPGLEGSVGVPHRGVLTSGVELPERGPGYVRYRPRGRNHWGIPRLLTAIEAVAIEVERDFPGGAPLVVGDLSGPQGGRIPGHRSHRTGRDVDFLFYVTTPSGAPVRSPGFVRFGPDGLARVPETRRYVRVDLERNWRLVTALGVLEPRSTQWVFVSRDIEALLIDYALARGEPLETIWRAQAVMLQPTDSAPHDDHFHVRLACTPAEAVAGCEGGGPQWSWLEPLPELEALDLAALRGIGRQDPPLPCFELPTARSTPSPEPPAAASGA